MEIRRKGTGNECAPKENGIKCSRKCAKIKDAGRPCGGSTQTSHDVRGKSGACNS